MGMSASQARFLCLTARKSNVEFEGQQINQQRTTLSNESANYYSELCNMTVPTPPSVDDYTKVSYTFNDGAMTNTITSMIAKGNGMYSISYVQQWQDDYSIVAAASSIINKTTNDQYYVGNTVLRGLTEPVQETLARNIVIDGVSYPVEHREAEYAYRSRFGRVEKIEVKPGAYYYTKKIDAQKLGDPIEDLSKIKAANIVNGQVEGEPLSLSEFYNQGYVPVFQYNYNSEYNDDASDLVEFIGFTDSPESFQGESLLIGNQSNPQGIILSDSWDEDALAEAPIYNDYKLYVLDYNQSNANYFSSQVHIQYDMLEHEFIYSPVEHYEAEIEIDLTEDQKAAITETQEVDQDVLALEAEYKNLLNRKYNNGENAEWLVRYVKDGTTGAEVPYFYKKSEVENAHYGNNGYALNTIRCFSLGSTTETKEILNQQGTVSKDSAGRYISITIFEEETVYDTEIDSNGNERTKRDEDNNPIPKRDENGNIVTKTTSITYDLTTNTITDEEAYNDAMNKYNYEQHQYDKKIQDINSKLEIVQQQDKSLELNLKQLDTEENAINTEMEAVKKVISKNVEQSFKTFEA